MGRKKRGGLKERIKIIEEIQFKAKKEVFDDIEKELKKPVKVKFCRRNKKPQTRVFGRITLPDWFKYLKEKHLQPK